MVWIFLRDANGLPLSTEQKIRIGSFKSSENFEPDTF